MNRFTLAGLVLLPLLIAGVCRSPASPVQDVLTLEIAPRTVECTGEAVQRCLLVRRSPGEEWTYFYDSIEGFTHEEGYRYRIEVARRQVKNPPADGSSVRYRLLRILLREPAAQP